MTSMSVYDAKIYGDYNVISRGSSLETDKLKYIILKGKTYKTATNPWFSIKYDENDDESIYDMMERMYINRDNIPFDTVEDFVKENGGEIIYNDGRVSGDFNACGLISLLGTRNINSSVYRRRIDSSFGKFISEDQLGKLAKDLKKKIYFLHAECGNMSVVILGDENSKESVTIHATGNHFEEINWD